MATVQRQHALDLTDGFGKVWLPYALVRKYLAAPPMGVAVRSSGRSAISRPA